MGWLCHQCRCLCGGAGKLLKTSLWSETVAMNYVLRNNFNTEHCLVKIVMSQILISALKKSRMCTEFLDYFEALNLVNMLSPLSQIKLLQFNIRRCLIPEDHNRKFYLKKLKTQA